MGFFSEKFGIKLLREAEVDGQEVENDQQATDYTDDRNNDQTEQQTSDYTEDSNTENVEDQQQEQPQEDNPNDEENQTTDYTEEGEGEGSENTDDNQEPPNQEEQSVDDIKKQEEDIYGNLTPEQLDIKHKELKAQYLSLYDTIVTIIGRIGDASISEENIAIAEYISNTLSRVRDMLADYMNDVYQGKSYIENSINYNRFLSVLNGINKILEELEKKKDN